MTLPETREFSTLDHVDIKQQMKEMKANENSALILARMYQDDKQIIAVD